MTPFKDFITSLLLLLLSAIYLYSCSQQHPVNVERELAKSRNYTPLHSAVYKRDIEEVKGLLKTDVKDINAKALWDETPLHLAAQNPGTSAIMEILIEHGADIHVPAVHKTYAIHYAASSGDVENIRVLLKAGADINVKGNAVVCGNCLRTPLETAIDENRTEAALFLIEAGARVNTKAVYSIRPDYYTGWAVRKSTYTSRLVHGNPSRIHHDTLSPLQKASAAGHYALVAALIRKGARVNHNPGRGSSSLALAAWYGRNDIVTLLLKEGADIAVQDGMYRNALHYALENEKIDIARILINHGAPVNTADIYGETPLHIAARLGNREVVLLLLEKGASKSAKDRSGKIPADYASSSEIKKLLE
jgi:ankyrin repeat protein